jgi:hypothetical protein
MANRESELAGDLLQLFIASNEGGTPNLLQTEKQGRREEECREI